MYLLSGPPIYPFPPKHDRQDENAIETYNRVLFAAGMGHPLWRPEPHVHPPAHRAGGICIGDIGIINRRGVFEFSFNICLPADHPVNSAYSLPSTFEPFIYSPSDVVEINDAFDSNAVISSPCVQQEVIDIGAQNEGNPRQFNFTCTMDGAVIVLPNGASRTDLTPNFRSRLLAHARKHALTWIKWTYHGIEFAGDIYLITGADRCSNWCLSSCGMNVHFQVSSVSFIPTTTTTVHPDEIVPYTTESLGYRDFESRTFSPDEHDGPGNQTIFVRGYKITPSQERLRRDAIKKLRVAARANRISAFFHAVPGAAFLGWIFSPLIDFFWNGLRNRAIGSFDNEEFVRIESICGPPRVHHPSDIINSYMLYADPDARVAITHDDDWCSVIEKDKEFPDGPEFLQWILRKYHPVRDAAGLVTLVQKKGHPSVY